MDHAWSSLCVGFWLTACLAAMGAEYLRLPYAAALALVGLLAGLSGAAPGAAPRAEAASELLLPALLFYGALRADISELQSEWKALALLAVPGLLVSVLVVGWCAHALLGVTLVWGLLLGAMLSLTDSVSALRVLGVARAPERLRTLLEGESLLRAMAGAALFAFLVGGMSEPDAAGPYATLVRFGVSAGGGALVGLAMGAAVNRTLRRLDQPLLQTALTVVLAFGAPLVADAASCSGPVAAVAAGLVAANRGRFFAMTPRTYEALERSWESAVLLVSALVFVAAGLGLRAGWSGGLWLKLAGVIALAPLARALGVYPALRFGGRFGLEEVAPAWRHALWWGGWQGAVSLALALGLPADAPERPLLMAACFGAVFLGALVQGLGFRPVLRRLKIAEA
ncbi:MAG: sodium:proton antiporter [Elusimicrobiota bacterium]